MSMIKFPPSLSLFSDAYQGGDVFLLFGKI